MRLAEAKDKIIVMPNPVCYYCNDNKFYCYGINPYSFTLHTYCLSCKRDSNPMYFYDVAKFIVGDSKLTKVLYEAADK